MGAIENKIDAIEIAHMIEALERVRDFIDGIHTTGRTEKVAELNRLITKLQLNIGESASGKPLDFGSSIRPFESGLAN